jgi:hypothetical protein
MALLPSGWGLFSGEISVVQMLCFWLKFDDFRIKLIRLRLIVPLETDSDDVRETTESLLVEVGEALDTRIKDNDC